MIPEVTKWSPVEDLPNEFFLEGLHDDHEGFRLLFQGKGLLAPIFRLKFESPLCYRIIDEGDYLKTFPDLNITHGPIFRVENSNYLALFQGINSNAHNNNKVFHILIITPCECIDVLCCYLPKFDWLS